jgi:hypothetical protein
LQHIQKKRWAQPKHLRDVFGACVMVRMLTAAGFVEMRDGKTFTPSHGVNARWLTGREARQQRVN